MDRRIDAVELLDGPLDDPATLVGNLRDLRRINRWLGGVRLSADAIDALAAHREQLTVLDVGTGGADIPVALLARAEKRARGLATQSHHRGRRAARHDTIRRAGFGHVIVNRRHVLTLEFVRRRETSHAAADDDDLAHRVHPAIIAFRGPGIRALK